jgi:hypothetical protein
MAKDDCILHAIDQRKSVTARPGRGGGGTTLSERMVQSSQLRKHHEIQFEMSWR